MIEEESESESEWEWDVDAAIEESISKPTRIDDAKMSLKEIIASITAERLATTSLPSITKKIPTKCPITTQKTSSKKKRYNILEVLQHHKH